SLFLPPPPPRSLPFLYTTLFRSIAVEARGELGDGFYEAIRHGARRFERMPVDRLAAALHVGVDPRVRDAAAPGEALARRGIANDVGGVAASQQRFERSDVRDAPVRDEPMEEREIVPKHIEDMDVANAAARVDRRHAQARGVLLGRRA